MFSITIIASVTDCSWYSVEEWRAAVESTLWWEVQKAIHCYLLFLNMAHVLKCQRDLYIEMILLFSLIFASTGFNFRRSLNADLTSSEKYKISILIKELWADKVLLLKNKGAVNQQ